MFVPRIWHHLVVDAQTWSTRSVPFKATGWPILSLSSPWVSNCHLVYVKGTIHVDCDGSVGEAGVHPAGAGPSGHANVAEVEHPRNLPGKSE